MPKDVKKDAIATEKLPPMTNIAVGMTDGKMTFTVDTGQLIAAGKKEDAKFAYCADTRGFIHIGDMMVMVKVMKRGRMVA
jgi:hypothetical protein